MSDWRSACCDVPVTGMAVMDDIDNDPVTCTKCHKNLGVKMHDMYMKQTSTCSVCGKEIEGMAGTCLCLPSHGSFHPACSPHENL